MLRRIIFILIALACSPGLFAQFGKKPTDLQDYQYHHEASGGLRLQSNGVSLFAEYGWIRDLKVTRLLQIEYTYDIDYRMKKDKSVEQDGQDYFYGLQNHFHVIRVTYGVKRTIADKADHNGVRLSFIGFGGIALGLLKPYYLLVQQNDTSTNTIPIRYTSATASQFLNQAYIVGAAPLRYGLNEIQPVPGLTGKVGLDFDWGIKDEFVKALEAGVVLDIYYKRLPIYANNFNRFYQFGVYLSFQFGKRW
jgi:hypothetical protein